MERHDILVKLSSDTTLDNVKLKAPWPVTPRDTFVINHLRVLDDGTVVCASTDYVDDSICPAVKSHVRAKTIIVGWVLKTLESGHTHATFVLQV